MATSVHPPRFVSPATRAPDSTPGYRVVPVSTPPPAVKMSAPNDSMEVSSPMSSANNGQAPKTESNGDSKTQNKTTLSAPEHHGSASHSTTSMAAPPPAAAAVHQPKIVQTAFIHKLYNMLEDPSIQHLISWSSTAESFIMSPSADFSKVLSQYFKHTNISSFVRQLNMYGFHKERDVFHTGSPDTTLWEFKHGNGNFKRGDLAGLREIKRRASRHALVNRETNFTKPSTTQPGTPAEPVQLPPETTESRLANLEHSMYDMGIRLQRSEEGAHQLFMKHQMALDTIGRLLHFNQELARNVISLITPDSAAYRDVVHLQSEIARQSDALRALDEPQEQPPYGNRPPYYSGNEQGPPVSPRQLAQDDQRRNNLTVPQGRSAAFYRPSVPSNLSAGARRPFGSISGTSPTQSSPLRNAPTPSPATPQPISSLEPHPSSLARRHTAADIRAHGWQPDAPHYAGVPPGQQHWPTSPGAAPHEGHKLGDSLSSFSLHSTSSQGLSHGSRPTTPPSFSNGVGGHQGSETFGSWNWSSAMRDKNPALRDSSAPSTRRGSMAHILNPSETAERAEEDGIRGGDDDRKRKRLQ